MSSDAFILRRAAGGRIMVPFVPKIEVAREYEHSGLGGARSAAMAKLEPSDLRHLATQVTSVNRRC